MVKCNDLTTTQLKRWLAGGNYPKMIWFSRHVHQAASMTTYQFDDLTSWKLVNTIK